MVTKQDIIKVRKMLSKLHDNLEVCLSDDTIDAIEHMCEAFEKEEKHWEKNE